MGVVREHFSKRNLRPLGATGVIRRKVPHQTSPYSTGRIPRRLPPSRPPHQPGARGVERGRQSSQPPSQFRSRLPPPGSRLARASSSAPTPSQPQRPSRTLPSNPARRLSRKRTTGNPPRNPPRPSSPRSPIRSRLIPFRLRSPSSRQPSPMNKPCRSRRARRLRN